MKKIDIANWERREIYENFSQLNYPFYALTMPVDVTNLREAAHEAGVSFYYSMVWACTYALNSLPEFRLRMADGELVEIDQASPSFTVLGKGESVFRIITMPWIPDRIEFCLEAARSASRQKEFLVTESETSELIYMSCLRWFDITALTNEKNIDPDDMIPRVTWGKYYDKDGGTELHLSIEVNHRVIDGYHIGQFKQKLDEIIAAQ